MRYHRRKLDNNQAEIVKALEVAGCTCVDLSAVGGGVPDVLCARDGRSVLFEIKDPKRIGKRPHGEFQIRTAEKQAKFRASWRGEVHEISTAVEAVGVMLR